MNGTPSMLLGTNTPALAGVLEYLKGGLPENGRDQLLAAPVIAYSLAYPVSVLMMILVIAVMQRRWKIDYAAETHGLKQSGGPDRLSGICPTARTWFCGRLG